MPLSGVSNFFASFKLTVEALLSGALSALFCRARGHPRRKSGQSAPVASQGRASISCRGGRPHGEGKNIRPALSTMSSAPAIVHSRFARLLALSLLWAVAFRAPLGALASLALHDEDYSYIMLVPAISMVLLFFERRHIFTLPQYFPALGLPLMLAGFLCYFASNLPSAKPGSLSLAVLAVVLLWHAGFVLCCGPGTFKKAAFPLLILFCLVPPPAFLLLKVIEGLQHGSAEVSYLLFRLAGVPVLKTGVSFLLPGAVVEVAPQCSSIRSSCCLMLMGMVAGHVILHSTSRKVVLALCLVPTMIFKNAARIVTISLLGVYVDPGFFVGTFHHQYSGVTFSALAIVLLLPVIWLLQKSELHQRHSQVPFASGPNPAPRPSTETLKK
jgi:exosortase